MKMPFSSKEGELLLQILRGENVYTEQLNTEHFLSLVDDHRLISRIAAEADKIQNEALVAQLYHLNQANKFAQLRLLEVLAEVCELFQDLPFTMLKGPVLSQQLYADPAERRSRDLDILIQVEDLDKALLLLKNAGYSLLTQFATPKQQRAVIKHYHHVEILHPNGDVLLEIHWGIVCLRTLKVPSFESLKSETIVLGGNAIQALSPFENLSYLCVHGLIHGFFRLQWLIDIRTLRRQLLDQEGDFMEFASSKNTLHYYLTACLLLKELFGDAFPEDHPGWFKDKNRVGKLSRICLRLMAKNDSFLLGPYNDGGLKSTLILHRIRFLCEGYPALYRSLVSRNIRPKNWEFFAFPDFVFFLNHLFSRPIWLLRKLFPRADKS